MLGMSAEDWNIVQAQFDRLCGLPLHRQTQELQNCGLSPRLRTELESLLAAHALEGVLDRFAEPPEEAAQYSSLEPGTRIGAFRIVGLIGSSNNPISGMTIATLMGTCLIFIAVGWSGKVYEPMALVVGGMICIAAANAGATSQDLKSGYIVGATPRNQQMALFIGAIVSSIVIGLTVEFLDAPTAAMLKVDPGMKHALGSIFYPAPQGTLMATLDKGIQSGNLDWQFVLVGVFLAITMELCGVKSLSFAVGAYLPLSTTLPIFIGGAIRGLADKKREKTLSAEEEELGKGNLFATGLVAGGAVAGVLIAILSGIDSTAAGLANINLQNSLSIVLGGNGYYLLGIAFFAIMGFALYKVAKAK